MNRWVCLKIGYIPNYSHLIGIMISKTIGCRGTLFSDKPRFLQIVIFRDHWNIPTPIASFVQRAVEVNIAADICRMGWGEAEPNPVLNVGH